MPPVDPLSAAIDGLYVAFASARRPMSIDWCSHCRSADDVAPLLEPVPLCELSAHTLQPYAAHVLTTIGDVADFRYFLPRIFEIACTDGFSWPDLEVLTGRLHLAAWSTWTPEEQAAIREHFHAFWSKTLATYPGDIDAYSALSAIATAEIDLATYLHEWTAALSRPAAAANLLDMLRHSALPPHGTRSTNTHKLEALARWITGPELHNAVTQAFAAAETEELLQTLSDIDEVLAWYPR